MHHRLLDRKKLCLRHYNGFGEIVAETVNANTLASFVKEQRELNNDEYLRSIESEEEQNYSFIGGNKNNVKKKNGRVSVLKNCVRSRWNLCCQ